MSAAPVSPHLLDLAAAAWRRLKPGDWVDALVVGLVLWAMTTLEGALGLTAHAPAAKFGAFAVLGSRWLPHVLVLVLAMPFGLALLDEIEDRGHRGRLAMSLLIIAVVTALVMAIGEPLALAAVQTVYPHVTMPTRPFWAGLSTFDALQRLWARGLPGAVFVTATWIFVHRQLRRQRRAARELHETQSRVAELQRRSLHGRLLTAQATVEPQLLFDAIAAVRDRIPAAGDAAATLLRALNGFLRAAMPPDPDSACTLGQQAELVDAYARLQAALRGHGTACAVTVTLEPATQRHPVGPALLLPLARWLLDHGANPDALSLVSERHESGVLVLLESRGGSPRAIVGADAQRDGVLRAARGRLRALYGAAGALAVLHFNDGPARTRIQLSLGEAA
jgi:hypothetical protein